MIVGGDKGYAGHHNTKPNQQPTMSYLYKHPGQGTEAYSGISSGGGADPEFWKVFFPLPTFFTKFKASAGANCNAGYFFFKYFYS